MEALNKNKEEIEKMVDEIMTTPRKELDNLSATPENIRKVTRDMIKESIIKTSIEWCEDEIEFLEDLLEPNLKEGESSRMIRVQEAFKIENKIEQLQIHLKWLKQKRGQDDN